MECRLTLALPLEHIPAQHQCCSNVAWENLLFPEEEEEKNWGWESACDGKKTEKCTTLPRLYRRVRCETIIYRKMGKKYLSRAQKSFRSEGWLFLLLQSRFSTLLPFWLLHDTRVELFVIITRDEIAFVVSWRHHNATSVHKKAQQDRINLEDRLCQISGIFTRLLYLLAQRARVKVRENLLFFINAVVCH